MVLNAYVPLLVSLITQSAISVLLAIIVASLAFLTLHLPASHVIPLSFDMMMGTNRVLVLMGISMEEDQLAGSATLFVKLVMLRIGIIA